jgi:RNA-directed DNA polymerase
VLKAYKLVKANAGGAGVDQQSLQEFELCLKSNLYKLWNRMSSGSYFPPPVKAVSIPKKQGGDRILGVPTVSDRIAQMVCKLMFEPTVESHFHPDSYGYRPSKSALEAVGVTRKRCWRYNWVLEFDIKGLFDNIDHELLMKAVRKHTDNKWVILYIERWLRAPLQLCNGTLIKRDRGTPQGGVISPVLSNVFLHYAFDMWMKRQHPQSLWCRYADDGLVHCRTEQEAKLILSELEERFDKCHLELHQEKTKIVYCKDGQRKEKYSQTEFTFLGYTFRGRKAWNSTTKKLFVSFLPGVSREAQKSMRAETRRRGIGRRTDLSLSEIAKLYNPTLRGWINYYGRYNVSSLYPVLRHFNKTLERWSMRKYRELKGHKTRASKFVRSIAERESDLFVHWKIGVKIGFV